MYGTPPGINIAMSLHEHLGRKYLTTGFPYFFIWNISWCRGYPHETCIWLYIYIYIYMYNADVFLLYLYIYCLVVMLSVHNGFKVLILMYVFFLFIFFHHQGCFTGRGENSMWQGIARRPLVCPSDKNGRDIPKIRFAGLWNSLITCNTIWIFVYFIFFLNVPNITKQDFQLPVLCLQQATDSEPRLWNNMFSIHLTSSWCCPINQLFVINEAHWHFYIHVCSRNTCKNISSHSSPAVDDRHGET